MNKRSPPGQFAYVGALFNPSTSAFDLLVNCARLARFRPSPVDHGDSRLRSPTDSSARFLFGRRERITGQRARLGG
ncbi:MAG: hypothetical protein C4334_02790 [Pyrinomonas sp.]